MNITIYNGKLFKHIGCVWDPGGSLGMTASYPLFQRFRRLRAHRDRRRNDKPARHMLQFKLWCGSHTIHTIWLTHCWKHPNRPPSSAQFAAVCSSSAQFTQFALRTQQFGAV